MNRKFKIKTAVLACIVVVLFGTAVWCQTLSQKFLAAILTAAAILVFTRLFLLINDYRDYRKICDKLWYVGENATYKAKKLYEMRAVDTYLRFAPDKELQKFKECFSRMKEDDYFYGEMRYVVERINKKLTNH